MIILILWFITSLGVAIFLYGLYYYLKTKIGFWWSAKQLRKIAKTQTGEEAQRLNDIADGLIELSRTTKLFENDNDLYND